MTVAEIPHVRVRHDHAARWRHIIVGPRWSTVPRQRPIRGGNLYGYVHRIPACGHRLAEGTFYGHDCPAPLAGWLVIAADGTRPYGEHLWETLARAVECLAET